MKINFGFLLFLAVAFMGWNGALAAPPVPVPAVVSVPVPTVLAGQPVTGVGSPGTAIIPPLGGTMAPGGVGGQFSYLPPGGQLMPGAISGGQLAPGKIPGGMLPLPRLGSSNFNAFGTNIYGAPTAPTSSVIVAGNSGLIVPGGALSGNGVGGSAVVVAGPNPRIVSVPGGFISGSGIGGSRVIVAGGSGGNPVSASPSSTVIVTGNALTGAGVGGTNFTSAGR